MDPQHPADPNPQHTSADPYARDPWARDPWAPAPNAAGPSSPEVPSSAETGGAQPPTAAPFASQPATFASQPVPFASQPAPFASQPAPARGFEPGQAAGPDASPFVHDTYATVPPAPGEQPVWAADPWATTGTMEQPVELAPVGARRPRRTLPIFAGYFAVALLAAGLASGGTYAALKQSGALDPTTITKTVTSPPVGQPTSVGVPGSTSGVAAAAARVGPAVVTVTTTGSGSGGFGGGSSGGIGSGLIFDANGWILTNRHVVADGGTITVALADGRSFPGTVYGTDTLTDFAIVKVNATGLPVAPLGDSSTLRPGEVAFAIGDPLGGYPGSVTSGVISGLNRSIDVTNESLSDLIQTDAAINPGNSGGPLVNANGLVIGLDTAASSSAQGIGFALPINLAKPLMQQALAGQKLARPWIGIQYVELDPSLASQNKLQVNYGAWINAGQNGTGTAIQADSPASKAGLKANDIITAVSGDAIDANHPLIELVSSHAPGSSVALTVRRADSTINVTLTLATRPTNVTP